MKIKSLVGPAVCLAVGCMCPIAIPLALMAQTSPTTPSTQPAAPVVRSETPEQRDARMAWWRAARFGMFIHWGIYSVPAGVWHGRQVPGIGEWIMNKGKIPVADYAHFADHFNPTKFDADAWVATAKAAGMKYIVITAKHHDGFAMFKSDADPYNIYDATPFKRDPLKELAEACKKQDMKLGFYYSQNQDWHHPGGVAIGGHWDKAQDGDYGHYIDTVALPQVRELLTNYGPVSVLWFDTDTSAVTPDIAQKFVNLLDLQPNIIVNNRLGGGFKGDTQTPEQHIPAQGYPGEDWETCMTINGTWGFKTADTNFKSTQTLLHNLIDIASKGGNYLLNVGPDSTGTIPAPEVERLTAIGKWLEVNGEAIYGTGPTPFGDEAGTYNSKKKDKKGHPVFVPQWKWRCTTKPGKLYLSVFEWPADATFTVSGVKGKVTDAYLLADPAKSPLKIVQDAGKLTIALPAQAPDPIASVVCVELTP